MSQPIKHLVRQGMHKAIATRKQAGADARGPICVYDICRALKVKVRFVDISMEGMYIKGSQPAIWLSALRPPVRRAFTCGHELGHHAFGHGSTIDQLVDEIRKQEFQPEEFLVDSFSGFLLMPVLGVRRAMARRDWNPNVCTPEQVFRLANHFGVGYETFISHLTYALGMIPRSHAKILLQHKPKAIRQQLLQGRDSKGLVVVDPVWELSTIDLELEDFVILPHDVKPGGNNLSFVDDHPLGSLYQACQVGIAQAVGIVDKFAAFVRVSRPQFTGLSQYRHMEDVADE